LLRWSSSCHDEVKRGRRVWVQIGFGQGHAMIAVAAGMRPGASATGSGTDEGISSNDGRLRWGRVSIVGSLMDQL
jgi:hypothetical protein